MIDVNIRIYSGLDTLTPGELRVLAALSELERVTEAAPSPDELKEAIAPPEERETITGESVEGGTEPDGGTPEQPTALPPRPESPDDVQKLKLPQLKVVANALGLEVKGNKPDFVAAINHRLFPPANRVEVPEQQEPAPPAPEPAPQAPPVQQDTPFVTSEPAPPAAGGDDPW
ncbi:MAG: SAP domain-containing protein, partial [Actinomycetota bacterium]|nr:SAP domain-containing protein [Actinomycetota bacterium]